MAQPTKIYSYFKRVASDKGQVNSSPTLNSSPDEEENPAKVPRTQLTEVCPSTPAIGSQELDIASLECDPGCRPPMWKYHVNSREEIRRALLAKGPYQIHLSSYPYSCESHPRRFQYSWFALFPWLEYSVEKDAAFCFPCYLFNEKPNGRHGSDAFTVKGFKNWKKVNNGKKCALLLHMGDHSSPHNAAAQACNDLLNEQGHATYRMQVKTDQQVQDARLRLKATIIVVLWLALQGCAFRGHDENESSRNKGNFLSLIDLIGEFNEEAAAVVRNAPYNSKYTSHFIQKEILKIVASKVRSQIRNEIGDSKFCIIVDEARDESKREQLAIILRFVDKNRFVLERFIDIVHVKNTAALTLKEAICGVLATHRLDIKNMRGQGYDGASNMRGEWNGLQSLFSYDCRYAYYVHCFAHQLQLALVAASREVVHVHQFFSNLTFIINIVGASCKRHDELQSAQRAELDHLHSIDELETGKGANQIGTLQRAGDTRWSSHFRSVCSFLRMFAATCSVLANTAAHGSNYSIRGDADTAYTLITSFEFILILHVMKGMMGITNILCQALQNKSQDIVNAMNLVSSTKTLIQKMRDDGWSKLLEDVKSFCEKHKVDIPDLNDVYKGSRGLSRNQVSRFTIEEHYRINVFYATIDTQLQELNERFNDDIIDLLTLSSSLSPKDCFRAFDLDKICSIVEKYYPFDYSEQEKISLRFQLQHYIVDMLSHPGLNKLSTMAELSREMVITEKSKVYYLVDRLIRLILTLPVSTATAERAFSAMKLVKTDLRNKMEDDYLKDSLIIYIEKDIARSFNVESIVDEFKKLRGRRAPL